MKNSIKLAFVAAFSVAAIAACTSTPAQENAAPTSASQEPGSSPPSVVTEVVTHTVTKPAAPRQIDSFGYGALKLGMSKQDAVDAKLIDAGQPYAENLPQCSVHNLAGTDLKVIVSTTAGVAAIPFTTAMSSTGAGIGATLKDVQGAHPNLKGAGLPDQHRAEASNNPNAHFKYQLRDGKVAYAALVLNGQNCAE
ncbi:hypothetical protein LFM09_24525 [Lentzea alba]|uniref:hypothetical protein n=1 Tax=Lentzea alba TaxID=2714351 RepID=UPI0039BF5813